METCSNCELRDAERVCYECDEVFCGDCALFHPKIKAYRGHDLFKYEPPERANLDAKLCWNCEEQTAKFQCKDCPPTAALPPARPLRGVPYVHVLGVGTPPEAPWDPAAAV